MLLEVNGIVLERSDTLHVYVNNPSLKSQCFAFNMGSFSVENQWKRGILLNLRTIISWHFSYEVTLPGSDSLYKSLT